MTEHICRLIWHCPLQNQRLFAIGNREAVLQAAAELMNTGVLMLIIKDNVFALTQELDEIEVSLTQPENATDSLMNYATGVMAQVAIEKAFGKADKSL